MKHEIAKEELLDAIQWNRKIDPEDIWSAITCPVTV